MANQRGVKLGSSSDRPRKVLELLAAVGLSRKEMSEALGFNVATRLTSYGLVDQGLIVEIGDGKYAITDAGRKALQE
jgi:hypothetical protein